MIQDSGFRVQGTEACRSHSGRESGDWELTRPESDLDCLMCAMFNPKPYELLPQAPFPIRFAGIEPETFNPKPYRGPSLIRNRPDLGPYIRAMLRALWGSWGQGHFSLNEVPLYKLLSQEPFPWTKREKGCLLIRKHTSLTGRRRNRWKPKQLTSRSLILRPSAVERVWHI